MENLGHEQGELRLYICSATRGRYPEDPSFRDKDGQECTSWWAECGLSSLWSALMRQFAFIALSCRHRWDGCFCRATPFAEREAAHLPLAPQLMPLDRLAHTRTLMTMWTFKPPKLLRKAVPLHSKNFGLRACGMAETSFSLAPFVQSSSYYEAPSSAGRSRSSGPCSRSIKASPSVET
eukprot:6052456-Amphidinium_carterae.1